MNNPSPVWSQYRDFKHTHQYQLNAAMIQTMADQDLKHFLTITVKKGNTLINEQKFIHLLNLLFKFTNTKLFRRAFTKRHEESLDGFVAIEHQRSGQPHAHILLTNDLPQEQILDAVLAGAEKVRLHPNSNIRPFHQNGIDIRPVEDGDLDRVKVAQYVTKEDRSIGFLGLNGVEHVDSI